MGYLIGCVFVALNLWMFWEVLVMREKLKMQEQRLDAQRKSLLLGAYNAQYRSIEQWRAIGALQDHTGCEDRGEPITDFPSFEDWVGAQQ